MRTMSVEKLLKGMPTLQSQIDALMEFDVSDSNYYVGSEWTLFPITWEKMVLRTILQVILCFCLSKVYKCNYTLMTSNLLIVLT